MHAESRWWPRLVALLVLLAALLAPSGATGPPSEAAPAMPLPQATVQQGAGRMGRSPTVLGDSNNVTVIDTTTNTVVGAPIPVGLTPSGVGIGP